MVIWSGGPKKCVWGTVNGLVQLCTRTLLFRVRFPKWGRIWVILTYREKSKSLYGENRKEKKVTKQMRNQKRIEKQTKKMLFLLESDQHDLLSFLQNLQNTLLYLLFFRVWPVLEEGQEMVGEIGRSTHSGLRVGRSFPRETITFGQSLKCGSQVGLKLKPHSNLKPLSLSINHSLQRI